MLSKTVLVLVLAGVLATGWLVRPGSWLRCRTQAPPALCVQSPRPALSATTSGQRAYQSQPNHWRPLVMRSHVAMMR